MKTPKLIIILFLSILLFSRCKLDPIDYGKYPGVTTGNGTNTGNGGSTGNGGGTGTTTNEYYFKGTLNNQAFDWEVDDDGVNWQTGTEAFTLGNQGDVTGSLTSSVSKVVPFPEDGKPKLSAEIGTFHALPADIRAVVFNAFVTSGLWNYGAANNPVGTKYITIKYIDKDGNEYSSVGTQTGMVNVISVIAMPASFGVHESLKIKLTFSCTLYPLTGNATPLTLTNAEATMFMEDLL